MKKIRLEIKNQLVIMNLFILNKEKSSEVLGNTAKIDSREESPEEGNPEIVKKEESLDANSTTKSQEKQQSYEELLKENRQLKEDLEQKELESRESKLNVQGSLNEKK